MIISAIVAKAENHIIGVNNKLPWHLPKDLNWFKQKTINRHIIMGRKSFESLGRPLPKRVNIVVTRDEHYFHSGAYVLHSISQALLFAKKEREKEVFILGGGNIYDQTQDLWDRLYLTEVYARPKGDTSFPDVDLSRFLLTFEEHHRADERHAHDFCFKIYDRI